MTSADTNTVRSDFIAAMRKLAATITLVTTDEDGSRHGMAATAVSSLSADPPALLVCVKRTTSVHGPISRAKGFCVNLLERTQAGLFEQFIARRGSDRFRVGEWREGALQLPYLVGAAAVIACCVEQEIDYGTHSIFIGRVKDVQVTSGGEPLLYQDATIGTFVGIAAQATKTLRLGHVRYPVTDMERAVAFYRDVVGLPLKWRDGDAWAAFDAGGATLALERRSVGAHQPAGVMASLKIGRDLDRFVQALREAGATVTAAEAGAHERVATLTDPDGNQTSLYVSGTAS